MARDRLARRRGAEVHRRHAHTWIGASYILALRSFFVYERESDRSLVIGAGLPPSWIDDPAGVGAERLPNHYGTLNMHVQRVDRSTVRVKLSGALLIPPGGILVQLPVGAPLTGAEVNGRAVSTFDARSLRATEFPADILLHY